MNQNDLVRSHLERHGYITPLIARQVYRVERLTSRVYDLRKSGFQIVAETRLDDSGKRYTHYSLPKGRA